MNPKMLINMALPLLGFKDLPTALMKAEDGFLNFINNVELLDGEVLATALIYHSEGSAMISIAMLDKDDKIVRQLEAKPLRNFLADQINSIPC